MEKGEKKNFKLKFFKNSLMTPVVILFVGVGACFDDQSHTHGIDQSKAFPHVSFSHTSVRKR